MNILHALIRTDSWAARYVSVAAQIPVLFFFPLFYILHRRQTSIYVGHPLSLLLSAIVKNRKAFHAFRTFSSRGAKIYAPRVAELFYMADALFKLWNGLVILSEHWVLFFFLCAHIYVHTQKTQCTLAHVSGNNSTFLSRRKKPHTSAQAHVKNYIANTICIFQITPAYTANK